MDLRAIAEEIRRAQDECRPVQPIARRTKGFDDAAAYEVARLVHEARIREGWSPVGRKIGFTNRNIWPIYGVYQPIWSYIYDTTVAHLPASSGACTLRGLADPRLEPEVALHFRTAPPAGADAAAVLACIDWIAHSMEIVQSHFPGWTFQAADTIADRALHGRLFVGEPVRVGRLGADPEASLQRFGIALSCNGELREKGAGSNVLGSPLLAAAHLICVLGAQPQAKPLRAGELVSTGTLTNALPVRAGETWSSAFDGIELPGMSLRFEA